MAETITGETFIMEDSKFYRRRWIALIFLAFSLLIIALDNTVLNLALPSIAKGLGSNASALQWIVDAYILVFAGLLLTSGAIGDRFGRKTTLQAGLTIFGLFSIGAALSASTGFLIGMRAAMGVGAALIMPSTLSMLTATFRDPKERAQAIAIWAATWGLGMGLGPLIGGWLLAHYSWSSVFYVNVPIVATALVGGYFFSQNSRAEHPRKLDIAGSLLSMAGMFALVYAIIRAGIDGWTASQVLLAFAAAAVLLAIFAVRESRAAEPMLPLSFFKNASFTGANAALTLIAFGLVGSSFAMSQYLQSVLGYTPLQAGVRLLPMAIMSFLSASSSARVAHRMGTKFTVFLGIIIAAMGFLYFSIIAGVNTSYLPIAVGMCIISLGIGLTMSPATNSVMGSIPVAEAGIGSAMNDTTRQIGSALGVAVIGTVMNSTYLRKINLISWPQGTPERTIAAVRNSIQGAQIAAQNAPTQLAQLIASKAEQAFVNGMSHGLVMTAFAMVAASALTLVILPAKVRPFSETQRSTRKGIALRDSSGVPSTKPDADTE